MGWIGLPLNPANVIVLPLLLGMGVDAGVHIFHRYRQQPTNRPVGLAGGTGKGITLTTLTTMIGFSALMLAEHRGIAGLGLVLTLGMGLTLLVCLTLMPALLELRSRPQAPREPTGEDALRAGA
jgi:predicted RND superfamily exporter protein